ncbi:MAG: PqqD family protein [bacterium]|nr:PqqD family protein [bacterium]
MVVDSDKALVHVLNPVGNRIFAMLDGTHTLDAIAAAVAEEFNVPAEQARQDVEAFLAELDSQEMLDHSSGQPAVKE